LRSQILALKRSFEPAPPRRTVDIFKVAVKNISKSAQIDKFNDIIKEEERLRTDQQKKEMYPEGETAESMKAKIDEYLMKKQSTQNMYEFLCYEVFLNWS
jgi:hypothetical protein